MQPGNGRLRDTVLDTAPTQVLKSVAVILNDKELVRLLTHLGLPAEFPKFKPAPQALLYEHPPKADGPPDEDSQLDQRIDYEAIEPAPSDD